MQIILNVDAIAPPLTGIGHYALQLARGLREHPGIEDIRYFSALGWIDDPEAALKRHQPVAAVRRHVPFKNLAVPVYVFAKNLMLRRSLRDYREYIYHEPNYLLPNHNGPMITTVHDLSYHHFPECHPPERVRLMHREMPRTLQQASHVITDAAFTKGELEKIFGVAPERISVVPLGVGAQFHPREESELVPALSRFGLTGMTYILVVGTIEPRKNLARLLEAYAALPDALRRRFPLVLCGTKGWLTEEIDRKLAPLEARGEAKRLGYVTDEWLPYIYAGAYAFAYPSIYEGFGLPPLEAMASGVPVLASKSSTLSEVVGDAGLLVDPLDIDAMAAGLERLLSDGPLREQSRARGTARAAGFTWRKCIDNTVAVYRKVIES